MAGGEALGEGQEASMSYVPVIPMSVTYTDGTPIFTVNVPVEDMADTLSTRLFPVWSDMVQTGIQHVDNYMQQKVWPRMREETGLVTDSAYARASSLTLKTGLGIALAAVGFAGGLFLYRKYSK